MANFKRRAVDRRKKQLRGKRGGNYRQSQGPRYKNPELMATQRSAFLLKGTAETT